MIYQYLFHFSIQFLLILAISIWKATHHHNYYEDIIPEREIIPCKTPKYVHRPKHAAVSQGVFCVPFYIYCIHKMYQLPQKLQWRISQIIRLSWPVTQRLAKAHISMKNNETYCETLPQVLINWTNLSTPTW